jgi:LacI family transcriptional regulator
LMISSSEESPDLERQEIDRFLSRRVDAIMIATMQLAIDSFHKIEAQKTPYVLLDRSLAGLRADFVGVDDVAVGRMATEHLIAVGCRRIAHVRGPATSTSIGRAEGYQQALAHHGLSPLNGYVVTGRSYEVEAWKSGFDAMENLLSLDPRPDGVFYYNDGTAIGGLDAILRAGLRVPEDIAVICCGNLLYDKSLRVPLSSVDQHSAEIGEQAGNLSIALIEAKTRPDPANILLAPTLVARESTRRNP